MTSFDAERAVLDRYCDAWRTGDLVALIDCYHDDFTLHYFGHGEFAGTHAGRDRALQVLAEVSTRAPRTLVRIDEVMAGPICGAIVATERLERDGEVHELSRVLRYRIADDRLRECWLYDEDQALVDRLWAAPTPPDDV